MFESLREKIKKVPIPVTPTFRAELELVFECLDECERGLLKIVPSNDVAFLNEDKRKAKRILERMEFISKRPIKP